MPYGVNVDLPFCVSLIRYQKNPIEREFIGNSAETYKTINTLG
jgi:hypothetical protein